jgi:hypothetical protein
MINRPEVTELVTFLNSHSGYRPVPHVPGDIASCDP